MQALHRQFKISPLDSSDPRFVKEAAALSIRAWAQCCPGEAEQRAAKLQEELLSLTPDKKAVFVALAHGSVIGFLKTAVSETDPSEWWLIGLVVSAANRRQGVARALVEACVAYARERGAMKLKSETHSDNETSIRFHEALGFTRTATFVASDGDRKVGFSVDLQEPAARGHPNGEDIRFVDIDGPLRERLKAERPFWARHMQTGDGFTLAALDGEKLAGVISVEWCDLPPPLPPMREGYVNIIEVVEKYRRKGIALRLVELALAKAKTEGAAQLRAWSTNEKVEAIAMWKALGFSLCPVTHSMWKTEVTGYFVARRADASE